MWFTGAHVGKNTHTHKIVKKKKNPVRLDQVEFKYLKRPDISLYILGSGDETRNSNRMKMVA